VFPFNETLRRGREGAREKIEQREIERDRERERGERERDSTTSQQ
jgi:hypothetical protein